jgi:hydrogenase/urease accessory protein HupE
MKGAWRRWCAWLVLLACATVAQAHESRPAYLEINEVTPARYGVLWRTPTTAGKRLPVVLILPGNVRDLTTPSTRELPDSLIERRFVEVRGGLAGKRITFPGLQGTITDIVVRVHLVDGTESTLLVHPSSAWVDIPRARSTTDVARAYVAYGIEHILTGVDHLLFLFALLLIVRGTRRIIATVTAFTVAHSLTLAAATLGWVRVPTPAVEAIIALSIVFVAVEVVRRRQGMEGMTSRAPWAVAFCFGLLHGFGFAGALAGIGLPDRAIPLALLCFNVGVEIGQLIFVCAALAIMAMVRRLPLARPRWAGLAAAYGIGGIAAFWMLQRVATFWQ